MNKSRQYTVEIVHIAGPLKGQIQAFTGNEITLGRHPSCDIVFPKDLTIVSRRHAKIVREGNRFRIIDRSTNGTFVNGKAVKECVLRSGDVITLAEGGPKLSFLLTKSSSAAHTETPDNGAPTVHAPPPRHEPLKGLLHTPHHGPQAPPVDVGPMAQDDGVHKEGARHTEKRPLHAPRQYIGVVIQYGPMIKSFKSLPVTVGTDPSCDFVIDEPTCEMVKLEISFQGGDYLLRPTYSTNGVSINGEVLSKAHILHQHDLIVMCDGKVRLEYLGNGRFSEAAPPISPTSQPRTDGPRSVHDGACKEDASKIPFFKKLFGL